MFLNRFLRGKPAPEEEEKSMDQNNPAPAAGPGDGCCSADKPDSEHCLKILGGMAGTSASKNVRPVNKFIQGKTERGKK